MPDEIVFLHGQWSGHAGYSDWRPYPDGCPTAALSVNVGGQSAFGCAILHLQATDDKVTAVSLADLSLQGVALHRRIVREGLRPWVRVRIEPCGAPTPRFLRVALVPAPSGKAGAETDIQPPRQ